MEGFLPVSQAVALPGTGEDVTDLPLPFAACVTSGKFLSLSGPPNRSSRAAGARLAVFLGDLSDLMPVRCPARLLVPGSSSVPAAVYPLYPGLSHGGALRSVPQLPFCGSWHFPVGQD